MSNIQIRRVCTKRFPLAETHVHRSICPESIVVYVLRRILYDEEHLIRTLDWDVHLSLFHLHTNNVTGQEQIKKRSEVFTSWFKNFLHNTPIEHRDDDSILNLSRIIFSVLTRSDLFRAVSTPLGFDRRTATFHRVLSDSPGVLLKSCIYPDGHEGIDKDMHKEFLRNLFR